MIGLLRDDDIASKPFRKHDADSVASVDTNTEQAGNGHPLAPEEVPWSRTGGKQS